MVWRSHSVGRRNKMKKYFLESNGYNLIAFVINNKMIVLDCETLEEARNMNTEGIDDMENIEEVANYVNKEVYDFNPSEWENVTEL